jgi:hypothetical protein
MSSPSLQVLVDPETFKGINSRLPELGGVVLDVVEKMRKAYFACSQMPSYAPSDTGGKPGQEGLAYTAGISGNTCFL